METINLGRVAFVYKGDYSAVTTYNKMDVVFDGESSFVSQIDNNVGNPLVNGLNWKYLSRGNNLELQEAKQDIATLETDLNTLETGISLPRKLSSVIGGNFEQNQNLNFLISLTKRIDIINDSLSAIKLKTIAYRDITIGSNLELYMYAYAGIGVDKGLGNKFSQNKGKLCKVSWYIYSKFGAPPAKMFGNRLGIIANASNGTKVLVGDGVAGAEKIDMLRLSDNVFKVFKTFTVDYDGELNYILFSTVWEASELPQNYVNGDAGITGLSVAFSENKEELVANIIDDWNVPASVDEVYPIVSDRIEGEIYNTNYNNLHGNIPKISDFLRKYEMKEVDEYNQLTITMPGDSIFGRVDKNSFTEATAEVSLTPDCNGGSGYGYVTGHFPPNMWEQIVGYKVLTMLQFPHADVKYYNHVAAEVTKFGNWINQYPAGADCLRLVRGGNLNDYIQLSFTGASFVKFIYSNYLAAGKTRKLILTISDDGGSTFKKIAEAGLNSSLPLDSNSGISLPNQDYKWGNIIISGLDKSKSYIFRVNKNDGYNLDVWGFETWSNPRINVVITAEGGNTAANQLTRWDRFYAKMYNPALIIYELPYLNDLGTGKIKNYKGIATLSTVPSASPTLYDFWYVSETGTYTNFAGVEAIQGDYIEWDGTSWKLGSTTLNTAFETYKNDNEAVFKRITTLGVPILTLVTHTAGSWIGSRPYIYNNGLSILRNLTSMYGLAAIDVNFYQMNYGYTEGIYSDGTHLNDAGVELYRKLIAELLNVPYEKRFVGICTQMEYRKHVGNGDGAGTVLFGFEFAKNPTVRTYNNSSIIITNVTQSGFTVTGAGAYIWEAFVE